MTAVRSYILCGTPRSGSTLLCDLLADTRLAGLPDSYFRRQSFPEWMQDLGVPGEADPASGRFTRRYLEAVRAAGEAGTGVFGLRLMWESLAGLSVQLDAFHPGLPDDAARFAAAFGPPLYVHLSRADTLAQAVSYDKALQSGLWHREADGTVREQVGPPRAAGYDAARLAERVAMLEAQAAGWEAWFARHGIAPLRIAYTDLIADPRGQVARVLAALGQPVEAAARLAPRTRKLADAESEAWIARFRRDRPAEG
jgi:LPS sulfotransferase NodH